MLEGVSQYPYLVSVIILCFILFVCCYSAAGSQRQTLLVGMLSIPGSFLTVLFVPDYWQPVRLFSWGLGVEDIIFSFVTGALVWFVASWPGRNTRLTSRFNWKAGVKRCFVVCVTGTLILALVLQLESLQVMSQVLFAMLATACLVGRRYRSLVHIALSTSILFGVCYTVFTVVIFRAFPHFILQWHHENLWGINFLTVPLEEIIWAFAFGFSWTLIMFYCLDVEADKIHVSDSAQPARIGTKS